MVVWASGAAILARNQSIAAKVEQVMPSKIINMWPAEFLLLVGWVVSILFYFILEQLLE